MKSVQHVLWRGALALSLMAVGVGSGIGMPPAATAKSADCPEQTRIMIVRTSATSLPDAANATAFVVRSGISPSEPDS